MSSKVVPNVTVTIEIGHKATVRHQKTPLGFTHDWEIFVQGTDGAPIDSFIDKVVFYLHSSFNKPKRILKKPPYTVSEHGYGGFILPVEIYFKSTGVPHKTKFDYDLYLQSLESPPLFKHIKEKLTFISPNDDFRKKLLQGGGVEDTNGQQSRINEKSSVSRPSSGAKTKPVIRHQTNTAPANHNSDLDKKKPKVEPKKELSKPKGSKADAFTALFGEIIKTGSDKKLKEKPSKEREKVKEKEKSSKSDYKKDKEKKDVKSPEKEPRKEHKKSADRDKERERDKSKKEKHEKRHKESEKLSGQEAESSKKDKKEVKKEHLKRPISPLVTSSDSKKRKPEKRKELEPPAKKEKIIDEPSPKHKEKKLNSEKDKGNEKPMKEPDKIEKIKVIEREKICKPLAPTKTIPPVASPTPISTQLHPQPSPQKEEKIKQINNKKPKSDKPLQPRPRGRPSKEAQRRAAEALSPPPPPPPLPPPVVVAKSKPKPPIIHPTQPPPHSAFKSVPQERAQSKSSSRSRSPSLSISSSSSPDRSRSSSASSRSSSRGGSRQDSQSRSPSISPSKSSSRSRSRSSSSSAKSRSKSPSSVKSHSRSRSRSRSPSRSVSRSRSKSKSVRGSGSCSSSCGSSPSRPSKRKRKVNPKADAKPLQLLGINDCSSDSEEKPVPVKSSPVTKNPAQKEKLTPTSSKSSPRQPPVPTIAKGNKTSKPSNSSDEESDSDSSPHPIIEKDVKHGMKGNQLPISQIKDLGIVSHPPEKEAIPVKVSNGKMKAKEEPIETLPVKNEVINRIDFTQDYFGELLDLREKIITSFSNRSKVQEIVDIIGYNATFQLSKAHFTFDLCSLDQKTIQKLRGCLS